MSRITSKLQVTIPKAVAQAYHLGPGSEVVFEPAGDSIRVRRPCRSEPDAKDGSQQWKLKLFDASTARQDARNHRALSALGGANGTKKRGWTRDELYTRGIPR
jgi:AbrB family looped-hinge helix DNA binding protein